MTYPHWWRLGWALVAAAILGPAVLFWSPSAVVAVFVFASLLTASVVAVLSSPGYGANHPSRATWRRVLRVALPVGVGSVATIALAQLSVAAAFFLVLLAGITAPGSVSHGIELLRSRGLLTRPGPTPVPEEPSPALPPRPAPGVRDLGRISDALLCDTWRRSLLALQAARDVRARLLAVHLREACLDEMERRNPEGVRAWLESGPSGSPDRYLRQHRPDPSTREGPGIDEPGTLDRRTDGTAPDGSTTDGHRLEEPRTDPPTGHQPPIEPPPFEPPAEPNAA